MDGGSTDETLGILHLYDNLVWVSEPDRGQSNALNKGLGFANGEIIAWINSDDTYEPGAFLEAAQYLFSHPDVDVVYGDCFIINAADSKRGRHETRDFALPEYLFEDFIPQQAAFFRRQALEDVGGWDDSLHMVMDYDLFLRLGREHNLKHVPRTWGNFRLYPGTKTMGGAVRSRQEKIRVLQEFFADKPLPANVQSLAREAYRYAYAYLFLAYAFERYQNAQCESARCYMDNALELYPGLMAKNGALLAKDALGWADRCAYRDPVTFIDGVVSNLPDSLAEIKISLRHYLVSSVLAMALFLAHERHDTREVRSRFVDLIRWAPSYLSNRGVLSIGFEAFFGERLSNQIRRLLSPSKPANSSFTG